jgi:hypothetical protein
VISYIYFFFCLKLLNALPETSTFLNTSELLKKNMQLPCCTSSASVPILFIVKAVLELDGLQVGRVANFSMVVIGIISGTYGL